MSDHGRFAIYYLPQDGPLAAFGASWLGWDAAAGAERGQPDVAGIRAATEAPRKYGFHGTLKAPFRLAEGVHSDDLSAAAAHLAGRQPPVALPALVLGRLGRFLALVPQKPTPELETLAARCVTELDACRGPSTEAYLARRRRADLTARQDDLLVRWGYPYVMEQFRFHMTLTGKLDDAELVRLGGEIAARLPDLPRPYVIDRIALAGERPDGRFEMLRAFSLTG